MRLPKILGNGGVLRYSQRNLGTSVYMVARGLALRPPKTWHLSTETWRLEQHCLGIPLYCCSGRFARLGAAGAADTVESSITLKGQSGIKESKKWTVWISGLDNRKNLAVTTT